MVNISKANKINYSGLATRGSYKMIFFFNQFSKNFTKRPSLENLQYTNNTTIGTFLLNKCFLRKYLLLNFKKQLP